MDINHWHSERKKSWVDLNELSKEKLIAEVLAERQSYLELEDEFGEMLPDENFKVNEE